MNNQFQNTTYTARIGAEYLHQSLECVTKQKTWAWRGNAEQVRRAKRKFDLAKQARFIPVLNNLNLKTNGVAQ